MGKWALKGELLTKVQAITPSVFALWRMRGRRTSKATHVRHQIPQKGPPLQAVASSQENVGLFRKKYCWLSGHYPQPVPDTNQQGSLAGRLRLALTNHNTLRVAFILSKHYYIR